MQQGAVRYYLFLATGHMSGSFLTKHSTKAASAGPMDLKLTGNVAEADHERAAFKAHGCIMVIAWLAAAPLGMLTARYYRRTWTSVKPCGKDLWFRLHQGFMALTITFTLIAVFIMLGAEGLSPLSTDSLKFNAHPVIGLICLILTLIQPVIAVLRPEEGSL